MFLRNVPYIPTGPHAVTTQKTNIDKVDTFRMVTILFFIHYKINPSKVSYLGLLKIYHNIQFHCFTLNGTTTAPTSGIRTIAMLVIFAAWNSRETGQTQMIYCALLA
jgi:hypothetical protein